MSDLYLSLLFSLGSTGLGDASFAFLLLEQPDFCGFLGSAILAGGSLGGLGFSNGVLGVVRPLECYPSSFKVVSCVFV